MSKFEDLFEDLDVHTQVMDSSMATATTLSTPEGQVDSLMKQVRRHASQLWINLFPFSCLFVSSLICLLQ